MCRLFLDALLDLYQCAATHSSTGGEFTGTGQQPEHTHTQTEHSSVSQISTTAQQNRVCFCGTIYPITVGQDQLNSICSEWCILNFFK